MGTPDTETGQVILHDLSDLAGKGDLVWVMSSDPTVEHILLENEVIQVGALPDVEYRFVPADNWNGDVAFVFGFSEELWAPPDHWDYYVGEIEVHPMNDAPTITGDAVVDPAVFNEGGTTMVTPGLHVADDVDMQYVDPSKRDDYQYTVEISVAAKSFPGQYPFEPVFVNGLSLEDRDGDHVWTATGSLDELNDALDSGIDLIIPDYAGDGIKHFYGDVVVTVAINDNGNVGGDQALKAQTTRDYAGDGIKHFYGDVVVTVAINDNGNVGGDQALKAQTTREFHVEPVNDQPELVGSFDPYAIDEGDGSLDVTPPGGFSITDNSDWEWYVGSAGDLTYRVEFHADYCDDANVHPFEISFVSGPQLNYDSTTGVWWLEAAVADLNDYLADGFNLTLADGFEDYNGVTFLYLTVDDLGNVGGDPLTFTEEIHINVNPVNDPPAIGGEAQLIHTQEGSQISMTGAHL